MRPNLLKPLVATLAVALSSAALAAPTAYYLRQYVQGLSAPTSSVPAAPATPSVVGDGVSKAGACASGAVSSCATWDALAGGGLYVLDADLLTMSGKYGLTWQRRSIRATVGKATGRWYWEITVVKPGSNNNNEQLGIANTQSNFADPALQDPVGTAPGTGSNTFRNVAVNSGQWSAPNTKAATWGATTVGFALDADSGKLFICQNDAWLGGADPVAGVLPRVTGFKGDTIYPAIAIWNSSQIKANFGSEPFTACAPPAGYNAGLW